jgi:hypothetical protein
MLMNSDARVVFRLDVLGENAVRATIEFANVTETAVDLQEVVIADKAQEIEIEDPEQDKTIQTELEEIKEVISTRATELWRSAQQWFSTSRSLLKESYAAKKVAMGPVLQTVSEHALQLKEDTAARASTLVTSLPSLQTVSEHALQLKEDTAARASTLVTSLPSLQTVSEHALQLKEDTAARASTLVTSLPSLQTVSEHALQLKEDTAARASTLVTSLKQGAATRTLSDVTNQLVAQTQILSASATPAAQKAKANAAAVAEKMKASAGVLASTVSGWASIVAEEGREFASIQRF